VKVRRLILPLGLLLALTGCRQEEDITSYEVKHPEREKHRLLGAILPHADRAWFVKLSGPEAEITEQKASFDALVKSIRFDVDEKTPIRWTAPDGWTEQAGGGMTFKAFAIDAKPHPLVASITMLDSFGAGDNTVDGNVNRWRKQIALPPVHGDALEKVVERKMLDNREILIVDLTGMGVFRPAARPAAGNAQAPHPPMLPPVGPGGGAPSKPPFRFEVPRGWEPIGAGQYSTGGYNVVEGNQRARVTITAAGGGVLANLKRWRHDPDQAGLPPIPDADVLSQAQTLQLAGAKATYADYASPQGRNDVRILGVILPLGEKTWFIKMIGPRELVGRQKANFEAFVKSLQLD
jgi:hypothetical protein